MSRALIVLCFVATVSGWPLLGHPLDARAETNDHDSRAGRWSGGAGMGFLANTPDGVMEFAIGGHADYSIDEHLSIGPLGQYAGVGNDFIFGLSVQAKYGWDLSGMNVTRLTVQGGVGFVRAGITDTDSGTANTYGSFLIPIGIGIDHSITKRLSLTADLLLNITSLGETVQTRGQEFDLSTNIMPAFYIGVRY
jgi:hypothetical protein